MRLCIQKCYGKRKVTPNKFPLENCPQCIAPRKISRGIIATRDDCPEKISPGRLAPDKFHMKDYHLANYPTEDCPGMIAPKRLLFL